MSTLDEGDETNIGLIYKLLSDVAQSGRMGLYYEAGNQWSDWSKTMDIIEGRGINRQIQRVYGWLASRYRPGDRIFLLGYSRGAYAVRSLAGVIHHVGLLRQDQATERMVRDAYRITRWAVRKRRAHAFGLAYCHDDTCRSRCWGVSTRSRPWAFVRPLSGNGPKSNIRSIPMPWGRTCGTGITRWRWTKRARRFRPCCGNVRRGTRA